MHNKKTTSSLENIVNSIGDGQKDVKLDQEVNTQVKAVKQKTFRRKFNKADKLKILEKFDACKNPSERGELLRKEGLYSASITKWRVQLISDANSNSKPSKAYKLTLEHNQVVRENATLKKKLAQAEAIIELQKKVSELLSTHVLSPEMSEVSS